MKKEWFESTDFYLAVWLICKGFCLETVYKNQQGRNTFALSGKPKEEAVILSTQFFNGGLIPAVTYKNVLNDLKTAIRNYERNGELNEVEYGKRIKRTEN